MNIYLIPQSFPCEVCNCQIEVKVLTNGFKCENCGFYQRMTYFGKYFGIIKDVKDESDKR